MISSYKISICSQKTKMVDIVTMFITDLKRESKLKSKKKIDTIKLFIYILTYITLTNAFYI